MGEFRVLFIGLRNRNMGTWGAAMLQIKGGLRKCKPWLSRPYSYEKYV